VDRSCKNDSHKHRLVSRGLGWLQEDLIGAFLFSTKKGKDILGT